MRGWGLHGIVVGVPGVAFLPLGVWLVDQAGYPAVFVAGVVATLAGLVVVPGLPGRSPATDPPVGVVAGLRTPALIRPAVTFAATAMAAGVVVTFLPLAVTRGPEGLIPLALFVQAAVVTAGRWGAGGYGDRHGPARLLVPGWWQPRPGSAPWLWSTARRWSWPPWRCSAPGSGSSRTPAWPRC